MALTAVAATALSGAHLLAVFTAQRIGEIVAAKWDEFALDGVEVTIGDSDRFEGALKAFTKKVQKSGILRDLRRKRYYLKPSEAKAVKESAARRRKRTGGRA